MNSTIPTPIGPVVDIAPPKGGASERPVFIDGYLVGWYRFTGEFEAMYCEKSRSGLTGREADAHEIARRLDGRSYPEWWQLANAIYAQERHFCDAHGESDRYGYCDECAVA